MNNLTNQPRRAWRKALTLAAILFAVFGLMTTALTLSNRPAQSAQASHPSPISVEFPLTDPNHNLAGNMTTTWDGANLITSWEYIMTPTPDFYHRIVNEIFVFEGTRTFNHAGNRPNSNEFWNHAALRGGIEVPSTINTTHSGSINWALDNPRWITPTVPTNFTILFSSLLRWTMSGSQMDSARAHFAHIGVDFFGLPLPTAPEISGYDFAGWYLDEHFTVAFDGRPITADMELHAKFTPIVYSITYTLNGGSMTGQPTVFTIECKIITLPTPNRAGYDFAGWFTNPAFGGSAVTQIPHNSIGNIRLYARWTAINYSITYTLNGGHLTVRTDIFTIESGTITLPIPTRNGFDFTGWFNNAAFNGAAITQIPQGSIGDRRFYAWWSAIMYEITYTLNGGHLAVRPDTYTIESADIILPTPTREGHHFKGWHTHPEFAGQAITTIPAESMGDLRLYARWEIMRFNITFFVRGEVYSEMIVDWGTVFAMAYLVDMQTLEVVELFLDEALERVFNAAIDTDLDLHAPTAFAIFNSLTFVVDGVEHTHLLAHNDPLDLIYEPMPKDGYRFMGWYTDETFATPFVADRLTTNTVIHARFAPIVEVASKTELEINWLTQYWWIIALIGCGVIVLIILGGIGYGAKKKQGG